MLPETRKHLFDIQEAAREVQEFTAQHTLERYMQDRMLRHAVERLFEIIGEAMTRIAKTDQQTVDRISEHRRIIAFRNQLIHGYDVIDHAIVWRIIEQKLSILRTEVQKLLAESNPPP
jgi:uncharacterized protein with HEPN domain